MPFSIAASGQQRPVGGGREPAHREVGDDVEAEHPGEQDRDVRRELGPVRQRDEDVPADRDRDDEQPEGELGAAPAATEGGDGGHQGVPSSWSSPAWWSASCVVSSS